LPFGSHRQASKSPARIGVDGGAIDLRTGRLTRLD
jgi:hypothetical protein